MKLLEIYNLSKRYCREPKLAYKYAARDILRETACKDQNDFLRPGEFWALRDIHLQVAPGEVVGVIGHNGAGKSTLINVAAGILRPTIGAVFVNTPRVVVMDYQGGLSPVQTGRENIINQFSLHGMDGRRIAEEMESVIAYSDLGSFIDAPVGTYSLGMKVRLAFSIYSHLRPDLFLVDEALNGGDLKFRMKFQRFLNDYISKGGAILLASHDLFTIQSLCHRCILMDYGQIKAEGTPEEIISRYAELAGERESAEWKEMNAPVLSPTAPTVEDDPVAEGISEETGGEIDEASGSKQAETGAEAVLNLVTFDSVEITGPDGGDLTPSGPVDIRVVVTSREDVPSVLWGIEIGTGGLFPIASLAGGYGPPEYSLRKGRNEFRCRIERLPLLPGKHQAAMAFTTRESAIILGFKGYQDAPITFEIKPVTDRAINMALFRKNLVHIPVEWKARID
ncbi:MAG: ATP-binding cassette domain-containing protein [Capsulimonadales bacterium]|nr:ATP-binding cassette domain-containing protein [Capsulimonadales bacterium]